MALKLYGNLLSQPTRAVAWLLKVQQVKYEFVQLEFGGEYMKSDEFLKLNPNGSMPVLTDGDFVLFESNAILTYLADKYDWQELYPKDLQARAKVNEYLHWHHTNSRSFSLQVFRPRLMRVLGMATPEQLELAKDASPVLNKVLPVLEKMFTTEFVAATAQPTVADYALYCEFDQLELMGLLTDMNAYPKIVEWLARMRQIPFHNEIRETMNKTFAAMGLSAQPTTIA